MQDIQLPLLKFVADKEEHSIRSAIDHLARIFNLSEEEKKKILPSRTYRVFDNRVGWAQSQLKAAGLIQSPKRGYLRITERGATVLKQEPPRIDNEFLLQFDGFAKFIGRTKVAKKGTSADTESNVIDRPPQETIEESYQRIKEKLIEELLDKVTKSPPDFFEKLVVELLVKMGYGGSVEDAGEAVGKSGDGGIDGVIKEDRLGLGVIYVQAKRYKDATVGSKPVRDFLGALDIKGATKGVFITTSTFSNSATENESRTGKKIVFIDGRKLAELMFEYDIGVTSESIYKIKKIDSDYFEDWDG